MDLELAYDKLYRYAYFKVHDRHRAEDITQEAFLRYLSMKGNHGSYEIRYLYTIVKNLCIDEYRKATWESMPEDYEISMNHDPAESILTNLAVKDALEKLDEQEKELLLLRFVNEESVGTISRVFQCSRFAVYRRIRQAQEKLRLLIGGDHT